MTAENELMKQMRRKMEEFRQEGIDPYPHRFKASDTTEGIRREFGDRPPEDLENLKAEKVIAGRLVSHRNFGKAIFAHLQDREGRLQVYFRKDRLEDKDFKLARKLDVGDIVGCRGRPFKTRTGELTLEVSGLTLLAKSLRPLPEKWHGLRDVETRYRRRYLDLLINPAVRETFRIRREIIREIREFFDQRGFAEVETPMMQPIPGGATARPFVTYHNALDTDLYLRIAPELYLKRLVVGGLERVYEINRNFRNEGISTEHNPEFTMLEFYMSYADYRDLMDLTEELVPHLADRVLGARKLTYQGKEIDLEPPWPRLSLDEALVEKGGLDKSDLDDRAALLRRAVDLEIPKADLMGRGKLKLEIFERLVEPRLINPAFITLFPKEISPLSKSTPDDPEMVERFELFIGGKEIANAFTELNDPDDQRARFEEQARSLIAGDEEAHRVDDDYITALEYGLPPTAGEGVGIDRLAMLFTDSASIRDVILFPQLRPVETREDQGEEDAG
jgi:lysyl-tRNA synthetase class 2